MYSVYKHDLTSIYTCTGIWYIHIHRMWLQYFLFTIRKQTCRESSSAPGSPGLWNRDKLVTITSIALVYDTFSCSIHEGYQHNDNWGSHIVNTVSMIAMLCQCMYVHIGSVPPPTYYQFPRIFHPQWCPSHTSEPQTKTEQKKCWWNSHLVGGLEHLDYFSIYWECHHPNSRTHIFQRDGSTTNQSLVAAGIPLAHCCSSSHFLLFKSPDMLQDAAPVRWRIWFITESYVHP